MQDGTENWVAVMFWKGELAQTTQKGRAVQHPPFAQTQILQQGEWLEGNTGELENLPGGISVAQNLWIGEGILSSQ